jgi:hypothetical protein
VPSRGAALADGVDSLAIGDVNGDQIADIVVAGRQGGDRVVDIYDGRGQAISSSATGWTVNPLAQLVNPLGKGSGPLSIAVGDFLGTGVSELAVASAGASRRHSPVVAVYQFQLPTGAFPLGSPVTPVLLTKSFTPPALSSACGLTLAAADLTGSGVDELIAAPAWGGASTLDVLGYNTSGKTWQLQKQISLTALQMTQGVFLAAGNLQASGPAEIAVGSRTQNQVDLLDPATGSVVKSFQSLAEPHVGARVAIVTAVNQSGALVITPNASGKSAATAVIIPAQSGTPQTITLPQSPGGGALVAAGGGSVYQRSTIQNLSSSFPTSNGPDTPTVLFGARLGTSLIVQGFTQVNQSLAPSASDTIVEPILSQAASGTPFNPLEQPGDLPGAVTLTDYPAVAYPPITYHSPFSINLSSAPASVEAGLLPATPFTASTTDPWGPSDPTNTPPTVPQGQGGAWLEERLLTVYNQAIGAAYQHHHDPFWLPTQGSPWNAVGQGYQSLGVDCTSLTAYAYMDALGIYLNGDTASQASISPTNASSNLISIPQAIQPYVQLVTLPGPTSASPQAFQQFVASLQPGDILYINPSISPGGPSNPSQCTHAITWLGSYGTDQNGVYQHLIVDTTGNAPPHVDSNNHLIAAGVHVRPFAAPNAANVNDWYYLHVDHVLRLIVGS